MAGKKNERLYIKNPPRKLPLLADRAEQLNVVQRWMADDREKLHLICEELGIAEGPDRYEQLALALAKKLYPGFQESGPSNVKWTDIVLGYLAVEVERLPGKHSDQSACNVLSKRSEWISFLGGSKDPAEALRQQYSKHKDDRCTQLLRSAFGWHQHENKLEDWHADLIDALKTSPWFVEPTRR